MFHCRFTQVDGEAANQQRDRYNQTNGLIQLRADDALIARPQIEARDKQAAKQEDFGQEKEPQAKAIVAQGVA